MRSPQFDTGKMNTILADLRKHPDSEPFLRPVEWKRMELYDYPEIIKEPMDLKSVGRKLRDSFYSTPKEVLDDIQKIWNNCKTYNGESTEVFKMALRMEKAFHQLIKKHSLDQNNQNISFDGLNTSGPILPRRARRSSEPTHTTTSTRADHESDIMMDIVMESSRSVANDLISTAASDHSNNNNMEVDICMNQRERTVESISSGSSQNQTAKRGPGRPSKKWKTQQQEAEAAQLKRMDFGKWMCRLNPDNLAKFLRIVLVEVSDPAQKLSTRDAETMVLTPSALTDAEVLRLHGVLKLLYAAQERSAPPADAVEHSLATL